MKFSPLALLALLALTFACSTTDQATESIEEVAAPQLPEIRYYEIADT